MADRLPSTAYIVFLQLLTGLSNTPAKCGPAGGLNFHLIHCTNKCFSRRSLFHAAMYSANSFPTTMKFVPLSIIIFTCLPLRTMKSIFAFREQSMSSFGTISICTTWTVKPVKSKTNVFLFSSSNLYYE